MSPPGRGSRLGPTPTPHPPPRPERSQVVFVSVADDGKIFHGSGVGDAFGPRCFKGDIMGCGIMFPRDYILDGEGGGLWRGWVNAAVLLPSSLIRFVLRRAVGSRARSRDARRHGECCVPPR